MSSKALHFVSALLVSLIPLVLAANSRKCPSGYDFKRNVRDCTKFYQCSNGVVVNEGTCPDGLWFSESANVCDWQENVPDCRVRNKHTKPKTTSTTPLPDTSEEDIDNEDVEPETSSKKPSWSENHSSSTTASWTEKKSSSTKASWDVVWSPSIGPTTPAEPPPRGGLNDDYKIVCYFSNWAWYRPDTGKFIPEDINPYFCTHINYAFAVLDSESLVIKIHDSWADEDNNFMRRIVGLKTKNPKLKVMLAIGGWNDSAGDKYSRLVGSATARRKFIKHAIKFLETYGFDGLDLDWEYPACWQADCDKSNPRDKENFSAWISELHAELKHRGLLLTAAVSPSKKVIDAAYEVPILAQKLDWINLMAYDYHGAWDQFAEHHAPLFARPASKEFDPADATFNVNFTVSHWMTRGMPARKIVLGVPFYGRSFATSTDAMNIQSIRAGGLGLPVSGGGDAGEFTRDKGYLAYYEVCELIKTKRWSKRRDPHSGPFAFSSSQWVGYDDSTALLAKTSYIKSHRLGGAMIWAIDLDDFRGRCCGVKYPLLKTLNHGLRGMYTFNIRALGCP